MESRTQGSRPRPRTQKNPRPKPRTAFPRTEPLEAKDRNARGQGQGPRTQAQVLSKKKKGLHKNFSGDLQKKKSSQKFFKRSPRKHVFKKIFQAIHKILTIQKLVLSSSRGQANFRGLEASRPRPRTWPSRPRPRTSKCVLEDVLEAKDVLKDSTSDSIIHKILLQYYFQYIIQQLVIMNIFLCKRNSFREIAEKAILLKYDVINDEMMMQYL